MAETRPGSSSLPSIKTAVARLPPGRFHLAGFADRGCRTGNKALCRIRPGSRERQNEGGYRGRSHQREGDASTPAAPIFQLDFHFGILTTKPDAVQNKELKAKFLLAENISAIPPAARQDPETDKSHFTFSANRTRISQGPSHRMIG